MSFYTNTFARGNKIYMRQVNDIGIHTKAVFDYRPYLFVQSGKGDVNSSYRTVHDHPVKKIDFESIYEAKNYIRSYSGVEGFNMYGMSDFAYTFIYDNFKGEIKYDTSKINVVSIDIETDSSDGYPDVDTADKEITMITVGLRGQYHAISLKDYVPHKDNIKFYRARSESELLKIFLDLVERLDPDVYIGWNNSGFDNPYLIRRIRRVLGEDQEKRMSPWGIIDERETKGNFGKVRVEFELKGVTILDYMDLYKKFTFVTRDNYKLDTIANVELGMGKVDYSEYGSLDGLWKQNPQLYAEYNIRDTEIIDMLEAKLKLLELVFTIAYDAKVNYIDTLATVRAWDVMIHNFLLDRGQVVPFKDTNRIREDYGGGYVKQPKPAKYKWPTSYDLDSLYPNIIRHYNISPETFRGLVDFPIDEMSLLDNVPEELIAYMKENNVTATPNKAIWSKKKLGFLPEIMGNLYSGRVAVKKEMKKLKSVAEGLKLDIKELEKIEKTNNTSEVVRKKEGLAAQLVQVEEEVNRLDMKQMSIKIRLNSAYGALANLFFRWYNISMAAGITSGARLTTRWTEKKFNEWLNKSMGTEDHDYVIYCDTDSVYLHMESIVIKKFGADYETTTSPEKITDFLDNFSQKIIEPFLDKIYDELTNRMDAFNNHMKMKREAIASSGIFVSAKMYALSVLDNEGTRFAEPKLKVTGLNAVRSSTPAAAREAMKVAMKILLEGDIEQYHDFVEKFEQEFPLLDYDEIASNSGVNGLDKYYNPVTVYDKGTPYHVKAVLLFNNYITQRGYSKIMDEIREGDKVRLMPLLPGNPIGSAYLALKDDLPMEMNNLYAYFDYSTQFDKVFLTPMGRMTKILGAGPKRIPTLESVFEYD